MDPRRAAFRALLNAHGAGSAISPEHEEAFISENLDKFENLEALCMLPNSVAILSGHPTNLKMGDAALVVSKFQPALKVIDRASLERLVGVAVAAELKRSHKKLRYSVTDAGCIGEDAIQRAQSVRPAEMFKLVAQPVPPELDCLRQEWPACTKEDDVQDLMLKACKILSPYHVLDTHKADYYKYPIAKIDLSLSDSATARWPTLVSALELKTTLVSASDYKAVVGQLVDRWEKVMEAQPTRQFMVGAVAGKDGIELWTFSRDGQYRRTGVLPLLWEEGNIGWQMLAAYLKAPASDLGYVPLPVPAPLPMPGGLWLEHFTPLAGVLNARPVYTAELPGRGEVVVKLGSQANVEREASFLSRFDDTAGLPKLLAYGALPQEVAQGISHFLVITPVGQLLGDDSDPGLVRIVFRDVASVLKQLLLLGILHRDISPSNIVHSGGHGILVDFHAARSTGGTSSPSAITGKLAYKALSLHRSKGQHSCATDMESLFYSLMDVASGGRALPWQDLSGEQEVYCVKYTTVTDDKEWQRALGQCNTQLQPWIGRLRQVVRAVGDADQYLAVFEDDEA